MGWIILLIIGFILWAAIGHVFWLVLSYPFTQISSRNCSECGNKLRESDKACRSCGWTSVPIGIARSLRISRQTLEEALKRGLIDQATLDRGLKVLTQLEERIELERRPGGAVARQVPSITPESKPSVPEDSPLKTIPHVLNDLPAKMPKETMSPKVPSKPTESIEKSQRVILPQATVSAPPERHALDKEYNDEKPKAKTESTKPSRTWTQLLSAFMEESNIRWGEIIGGLLIVCCSTALVISFWENIASRPWLKFSIFTGINLSTLGLGLYAWHRWKLPTTSKGILMIGMLQMPLNFLAFALFTMGMPWDWPTVAGEILSMAILGYLVYMAAKILTPGTVWITTCTLVVFGLANLLIRRSVSDPTGLPVVYAWALGLTSLYAIGVLLIRRPLISEANGRYAPALEFLTLSSFGLLLSSGLLLRCAGQPMEISRMLSPVLTLMAIPSLLIALDIGRRIDKTSSLQVPMLLLGLSSIGIGGIAVLFSWPAPLLMIATGLGVLVMIAIAGFLMRHEGLVYPASITLSLLVVLAWYGLNGQIEWMNKSTQSLISTLATPMTGFVWVGYSLVCVAVSMLLTVLSKPAISTGVLRSAFISGALGTVVLTAFGFGRDAYATSLGIIYGLYAISAFIHATLRRKPSLEAVGIIFLVAASFQWIVIGWTGVDLSIRVFGSLLAVSFSMIVVMLVQHALGFPRSQESPVVMATFISLVVLTLDALFLSRSFDPLLIASLLWFVYAWLQVDKNYWRVSQLVAASSSIVGLVTVCKTADWWTNHAGRIWLSFAHPMFLQYLALSLFLVGLSLVALSEVLRNSMRLRLAKIAGPLLQMHDLSIAKMLIASGAVLTIGIMIYGAIPGVSQEIIPRDALSRTQLASYTQGGLSLERPVPALSALELSEIPHAAASWGTGSDRYRVWGAPPILAVWSLGIVSLLSLCWSIRNAKDDSWQLWIGIIATLLVSIWYPISTFVEPSVSVASLLRWLTAFVFTLACLLLSLWIRRVDRATEPTASASFSLFDRLFSAVSLQAMLPWIGMGSIVCVSVLMKSTGLPGLGNTISVMVWLIAGLMALAAIFMFVARSSNPSDHQYQVGTAWNIAASVLLLSPLVAWVLLQIVVTLIAHPLTGPNPDTLFSKMGLAGSYAIPILMVAIGLISVAASRPNPRLAFTAAIFLMTSIAAGYLLVLKSKGVQVESWIGLCAVLSATASFYSFVWNYFVSKDHRSESLLHWNQGSISQVRQDLQGALHKISMGFAIAGLGMIAVLVLLPVTSSKSLALGSAGILAAILLHCIQAFTSDPKIDIGPWILGAGVAVMGIVSPSFSTLSESLGSSGTIMFITGLAVVTQSLRSDSQGNRLSSPRFALWWVLGIAVCISVRAYFGSFTFANRTFGDRVVPFATLVGAWALAAMTVWLHSDRMTWSLSLLLAHLAGLAYTVGFMFTNGIGPAPAPIYGGLMLQIAIAAASTALATFSGFGSRSRIPLILGTLLLSALSATWLLGALSHTIGAGSNFSQSWFALAIGACALGGVTGFWNRKSKDEHAVIYLSGLSGCIWLIQLVGAQSEHLFWFTTIVFAAYCLASSFLWSSGERIQQELTSIFRIPNAVDKPRWMLVVPFNLTLALGVAFLGVCSQFVQSSQNLRFVSANAIMAVAVAIGFMARYASIRGLMTPMKLLALIVGVLYSVSVFWHVQDIHTPILSRFAVASLPLVLTAALYGFGLIKWFTGAEDWKQASFLLVPWIVALAIVVATIAVMMEWSLIRIASDGFVGFYPAVCLILSFVISMILCLAAALLPGKDPLGLSDRGREAYVYAPQAIMVLLVIHLRASMPFLFGGWIQSVWPMLVVAIGFVGIGIAEWSERRGLKVLANPLRNSGSLLPLLPILAPWIAPSQVDQGVTMLVSAVGYGMFGYLRTSPIYITASILCANIAFWQLLHKNDFSVVRHPQLWVIPPALCVFAAGQFFKNRMAPQQLASLRYASIGSIYVASTSEIFLQGIANAPWLPIVLAVLSVAGILFGIAARIRSMLWLGSMFLAVALFSILWYAAVDLNQTWIWYVCGIVLGAAMLFVFAMFEKRREELKRLMTNVQTWEE
jgi:hypothetical protein